MGEAKLERLSFLTEATVRLLAKEYATPLFVYDQATLEASARVALSFPHAYGLTVRFAMKCCPNRQLLKILEGLGLHFDASSAFEVERLLRAGIPPEKILLTSQELPSKMGDLLRHGIRINATSLEQLRRIGEEIPGGEVGLRINPGLGSGGTRRTNVGGPASSFGVWHQDLERAETLLGQYRLRLHRVHTHIGSGSDPKVWEKVALLSLDSLKRFPQVHTLNLGGGFKVGRMSYEATVSLREPGLRVKKAFEEFAKKTGRRLHLEIEPGTFIAARAGAVLARVQDKTATGKKGYQFLKLDMGMTELLRPSLYGAQHPIIIVPHEEPGEARRAENYLVCGHCCESGDILTPAPGDSEGLLPRRLLSAGIGDWAVVEGAGAYAASMAAKNYNSFPEAPEVLLASDGTHRLIRRRQTMDQMLENENV